MSHRLKTSRRARGASTWAALATLAFVAGCGGRGSTGLILPEGALLADVRETRTCVEANGTTYCATDSEGPRGQHVGAPTPSPAEPCQLVPADGDRDCSGDEVDYMFRPSGFAEGAACALATRMEGGDAEWIVSPPVALTGAEAAISFFADLPSGFSSDDVIEAALLCFDQPPGELTSPVARLADLGPDVIFVAPLLPASGAAPGVSAGSS
ncbi:MAG: hypothetical protein FJ144_24960 [Deltaproteobacteria bacterium]|nr:hypothetical protein [Deltaproteobacteria bacterium]